MTIIYYYYYYYCYKLFIIIKFIPSQKISKLINNFTIPEEILLDDLTPHIWFEENKVITKDYFFLVSLEFILNLKQKIMI